MTKTFKHSSLCAALFSVYSAAGLSHTTNEADDLENLMVMELKDLLQVKVHSSTLTEKRLRYQPASLTVIHQEDIQNAYARTLNELLSLYVPGYFRSEDKDDTIASFRGLAPDNNSKVLLLVNGVKVNADWFWGPSDSLLNGIDLNYIERIEVIRGPGSVTQGQGAQLGVINIITRKSIKEEITVSAGSADWYQVATTGGIVEENKKFNWYLSQQALDGYSLDARGWAIEVVESDSSHPAPASPRGNRLNRSEALRLLLDFEYDDLKLALQHHRQKRDLHNWTKDRDQVEQRLTIFSAEYHRDLSKQFTGKLAGNWQQDDYALYDHTFDLTTGGARETRFNFIGDVTWQSFDHKLTWASGFEYYRINTGDTNWQGHNFIVNQTTNVNADNNSLNTWVFENTTTSNALFTEISAELSEKWLVNVGLRFDQHPNWGDHVSPRLSTIFTPNKTGNSYRLTYSTGFRGAPGVHYSGGFLRDGLLSEENFDQLDGSGMTSSTTGELITSLPTTQPEELRVIELGMRGGIDDKIAYDFVYYRTSVDNIIITESTRNGTPGAPIGTDLIGLWGGVFYYTNAPGELVIDGIEISGRYQQKDITHILSYSLSHIVSADGFEFGQKSPVAGSPSSIHSNGIPEQFLRYLGRWKISPNWSVAYQHMIIGDWYSPWTNTKAHGYGWGNLSFQWNPQIHHQLSFKIGNLWQQDDLYPIRERGRDNETPGTPTLEPRSVQVNYTYSFD